MGKKITILDYSAASNSQSAKKLKYDGNHNYRPTICILAMNRQSDLPYDIISVRDINFFALEELESSLRIHGYNMFIHPDWEKVKNKGRYTCLQSLFIKNNIDFHMLSGDETYSTTLRSVSGYFPFDKDNFYFRASHTPQVDAQRKHVDEQIKRKENMLKYETNYQAKHNDLLCMSIGDFNGNGKIDTDCYCKEIYEDFCFFDLVNEATFENHQLDSIYISKALKDDNSIKLNARVLQDYYMQFSDHRMLSICIEKE